MNAPAAGLTALDLALQPLTPTVGVEIHGVDSPSRSPTRRSPPSAAPCWNRRWSSSATRTSPPSSTWISRRRFGELEVLPVFAAQARLSRGAGDHPQPREPRPGEHLAQRRDLARDPLAGLDPAGDRGPAGRRRHPLRRHGHGLRPAARRDQGRIEGRSPSTISPTSAPTSARRARARRRSRSSTPLSPGSSIRWCAPTRRPARSALRQRRLHPAHRRDGARSEAASCWPSSTPRPRSRNTSAASAGRRTPSPSGTTAPASTTRPQRLLARACGGWSG